MKDDYSYWSENLHSAYLFYTLEVDKLNRENKRLREALEIDQKRFKHILNSEDYCKIKIIALQRCKQALGE